MTASAGAHDDAMPKHKRPSVPGRRTPGASRQGQAGTPALSQSVSRAFAARERGDLAEAERLCRTALLVQADYFDALHLLGVLALQTQRAQQAAEFLSLAVSANPKSAEALNNRGAALRALGRHAEALESYERAVAIKPDFANAQFNRGNVLGDLTRHGEALESYRRALALKPDYAAAHYNLGNALGELRRHREAIDSYQRALALNPRDAKAHWNLALCHLLLGEFAPGWREHEWRWQEEQRASHKRNFAKPLWLGEQSLEGTTILLHCEQGLGDTLQFYRYVRLVVGLGANVVLEVQPPLVSLLGSLGSGVTVIPYGTGLPAFDYHCPLMSLPLAFRTDPGNIPAPRRTFEAIRNNLPVGRTNWA